MKLSRHISLIMLSLLTFMSVMAAPVSVRARLDSVQILMGKLTVLHLEAVQRKGEKGGFPMFSQAPQDGYVGVCGDSVELRTSIKRDTIDLGSGMIQINHSVPVQAFDSGTYRLPQFVYVSGRDTARSNSVALKVIPVPVAADAQISDYADPVSPEGSVFDFLPDWLIDLWWLWLSIILLAVLFIIGMRRYRKQGGVLRKKPEPNPYEVAIKRLGNLKNRRLWEQGMEKEYFTLLTDILREYLERRFDINAMEMTTRQIIDSLSSNTEVKEKRNYMREILDVADFVKFAKVRPLPSDNIAAFDNAVKFVEETKPVEKPDADDSQANADAESNIKTGIDIPASHKTADNKKGGGI